MRDFVSRVAVGLTAIGAVSAPASADVLISSHATVHMVCSAGVCTPNGANAVLNAGDLQSMLAASSVTIKSNAAAPNIRVGVAVTWASANMLTLDSYRAVTVDRAVSVTGPGGLTVTTNDGGTGGELSFAIPGSARVIFWDLGSSLKINGASYVLVGDIATLAGDIAASPTGHFALANNYNASVEGVYSHSPIETPLDGVVEGLGNTIDRLAIVAHGPGGETSVGLFARIGVTGVVSDLRMTRVNIRAANKRSSITDIGGMAGISDGLMSDDSVSGQLSVTHSQSILGGMVGEQRQGVIKNASSSVTIAVTDYFFATIGGLVGMGGILTAPRATISNSHSSATISIGYGNSSIDAAGGLAGQLIGDMTGCTADGNVTGAYDDGGLVGFADTGSTVTSSHATGYVFGSGAGASGGGLVGFNFGGSISKSYASGLVVATNAGGLVGTNEGTIDQTFATGNVSGGGGLVGANAKSISNSYATGAVSGGGGLAQSSSGNLGATISSTYATGSVTGGGGGGLLGEDIPPAVTSTSYWDTTTSGITNPSQGAGNPPNDPGITGLTTAQLQSGLPAGFSPSVWGSSAGINGGLPYLLAVPPP